MEEFPRNIAEFEQRFSTEEDCYAYLRQLRWPDGFRCPRCHAEKGWAMKRGLQKCSNCGYQASVIAGTIFHRTHLDLRSWFRAIWWVTNQKQGVSALGLQRLIGLGSYETAWACLHKLRRAMVRPGRDRLVGTVEVDETYVGGVQPGGGRRHLGNKALVAIAAEMDGKGIGRIRMARIEDASASSLRSFVEDSVEPGSIVTTDGWEGYEWLTEGGYKHRQRAISGSGKTASALLPRVHRVSSLLKRWLLGTHQGGVSRDQLEYYLDEFTFRFNRRTSNSRGKLFYRLLQQAVLVRPHPIAELSKSDDGQSVVS
jgi:transposase-like protein